MIREILTRFMHYIGLKKTRILIIAANPIDTPRIRLEKEIREIKAGLKLAKNSKRFKIKTIQAARPKDVRRALLSFKPNIIHYCGHGEGDGGIAFENEYGNAQYASTFALAELMGFFRKHAQCVVLNACYSEVQAKAISEHISYVIGMNAEIGDEAAIEFSVGFYDFIGAGKPIKRAYKAGCNAIQLSGIPEHLTPVLKQKNDFSSPAINKQGNTNASIEENSCGIDIEKQRTERRELWNNNEQSIMRYIFAYSCNDANFEAAIRIAAERINEKTLAFKSDKKYLNVVLEQLTAHEDVHSAIQDIRFLLGALNFR